MSIQAVRNEDRPAGYLRSLSDQELLQRLSDLLRRSRRVEADLVVHIGEVDERRLYLREGSPSMYVYCTEVLRLSEHEAYLRIAVARGAREHPALLRMLAEGRLHLSGIAKLLPHLTPANRNELLERATHKSKRQIEELVAELAPRADAPSLARQLLDPAGERVTTAGAPLPQRAAAVQPLGRARYRIHFTASAAFHDKLQRLRALMRTSVPDGDLAAILEAAVSEKLERLQRRRFGGTPRPRKSPARGKAPAPPPAASRYLPAAVRRAVYQRDGGQCRYVGKGGRRCGARDRLEFHHVEAYGRGGGRSAPNIQLMCRAHNMRFAELDYGRGHMARYRRRPGQPPGLIRASASTSSAPSSRPTS
jgi:hypothetical protein